eukprot:gene9403-12664_t
MSAYQEEELADFQEDDDMYGDGVNNNDSFYGNDGDADAEPEEINKRVQEMEQELDKLTKMQQQVDRQITSASDRIDENSIYVGQVDYEATPEELRAHFSPCGTINRITIMCDKITGQAKGFAYVEFVDKESVDNALKLDDSTFRGRQLKVLPKRQNIPVIRGGRGRSGRGGPVFARGRGRGFYRGFRPPAGGRFPPRGGRGGRYPPSYHNSYY